MWLLGAAARGLCKNCWKHIVQHSREVVACYRKALLTAGSLGWCPAQGQHLTASLNASHHQCNKGKLSFVAKDLSAKLTLQTMCRVEFFSGCTLFFQWLMKVGYLFSWACQSQGLTQTSCLVSFSSSSILEDSFFLHGCFGRRHILPLYAEILPSEKQPHCLGVPK